MPLLTPLPDFEKSLKERGVRGSASGGKPKLERGLARLAPMLPDPTNALIFSMARDIHAERAENHEGLKTRKVSSDARGRR